ncbi:hypothetical protein B1756_18670 [Natrarchaeobaculum aegyptiacum]|uniref:Uncharacterized protein n=1 Tax=Natrarchaeobaculum aegyptiacum TaxID=745377 RepID=A0A2Z2HYR9_9EURY|nr:hypothetical protein B1756_18670 [Natrarchaeobaculum aegyptiacum]
MLSLTGSSLAVAAGTALAGCTGTDGTAPDDEPDDESVHDAAERPPGHTELEDDEDVLSLRADDADPVVFESEADVPEDDREYLRGSFHVIDDDGAAALYVDGNAEQRETIEQFVDETDFETQSIFVDQRTIGDCYDLVFLGAEASEDSVRTAYCRSLKSPTTPCETDHEVVEAVVVRLGRPYDDPPSGRQSSMSGSCPPSADVDDTVGADTGAASGDGTNESAAADETATPTRFEEVNR